MTTTTQQHDFKAPWSYDEEEGNIVDSEECVCAHLETSTDIQALILAAPDLLATLERSTQRIAELCAVINAHAVGVVADADAECAEYWSLIAKARGQS